jgi:imidazoleglycerol-phosphate dehydratase
MKKRPRKAEEHRETKETRISIEIDFSRKGGEIETGLPFFTHLLYAMSFHGGFFLTLRAEGDTEVDPHHLVEDTGLVLGKALATLVRDHGAVRRFGHAVIPMDDALAEVTIDAGGRPYLVYHASYPQEYCGEFSASLLREFLLGLTNAAKINLHADCRCGENSHHMAEALFKALGRALFTAYETYSGEGEASTKGNIES